MRRILSLLSAVVTFAACSSPTAPSGDPSASADKAKSALGAVAKTSTSHAHGKLSAN